MEIRNDFKISNPALDGQRNICQRRAATISYMLDEAKKRGLDEEFARAAIYQYGKDIGEKMFQAVQNPMDLKEFETFFAAMPHRDIYEMTTEECTDEKLLVHFHYCPYVAEWLEQNRDSEELSNLCDLAMEGDRAIGDCFPAFQFRLGKTIAQGNSVCEIEFTRKRGVEK